MTTHSRYHICHDDQGVLEFAINKRDAIVMAGHWANELDESVAVFDSMARFGSPDCWRVWPGTVHLVRVESRKTEGATV